MSDWTVHLYTAPKQIDAGDYAPCVGKPIPDVKVLDNVLTTLRYKANELRGHGLSYLHEHDGRVHIGEYGTLSEKFGSDYPYGVDGHDMNGRAIKYFYGFSAPKGTPVPSLDWMKQNADWRSAEIDKLVRLVNEADHAAPRNAAQVPEFPSTFEYGESAWDNVAQRMNEGKVLKGVFTPGIEETVADIHQRVEGILTESDITKNIAGSETTSWISKLKPDLATAKGKAIMFAAGAAVVVGGVMLARHFSQRQQPEQPAVAQPR